MKEVKLGKFVLRENSLPYIIAEIGVNHEGSLEKAKELIIQAKEAGANAVKFQTYIADKLASKNSPSYWDEKQESTKSQYELFKKYDNFRLNDYKIVSDFCQEKSIEFLTTPFDIDSVNEMDSLLNFYKVSSSDITNYPLLREISKKGKPIILSTGASSIKEIKNAIKEIKNCGGKDVILLHCVLNYPTQNHNANLNTIKLLKEEFPENFVGYSDHTLPNNDLSTLIYSYLLGAVVIEKHFTNDKKLKGNDHYHSMDKEDLRNFTEELKLVNNLLGSKKKEYIYKIEALSRKNARRSLFYSRDIKNGSTINEKELIAKRPAEGICPSKINLFLGRKLKKDVFQDNYLKENDFE